jgi:hypothetical protein
MSIGAADTYRLTHRTILVKQRFWSVELVLYSPVDILCGAQEVGHVHLLLLVLSL